MKKTIPPVKGTRDFYPEQMAIRNWLYSTVRSVSEILRLPGMGCPLPGDA